MNPMNFLMPFLTPVHSKYIGQGQSHVKVMMTVKGTLTCCCVFVGVGALSETFYLKPNVWWW